jgi:DNA-binding MarR family transcriptional regulator
MRALGEPGRWKIAVMLATEGPRSVKDMQNLLGWKQQRTSFHATILFDAGLVTRESAAGDGRFTIYRLTESSLAMVQAVLAWQPAKES